MEEDDVKIYIPGSISGKGSVSVPDDTPEQ